MDYFIPKLQLGVLSKPQVLAEDKFGGLPWGLPQSLWPICKQCHKPMSLIAQFNHDSARLDLGKAGRCLYIFVCSDPDCAECTYSPDDGASACLIIEPELIESGLTYPPGLRDPKTAEIRSSAHGTYYETWDSENTIWIATEARVTDWEVKDDGLSENLRDVFNSSSSYFEIHYKLVESVYSHSKLGSVPYWIQEPEEKYKNWTFIGQFSEQYRFHGSLPRPEEVGCPVGVGDIDSYRRFVPKVERIDSPREIYELDDDSTWDCDSGANFGCGIAYVFIDRSKSIPKCELIWQCS